MKLQEGEGREQNNTDLKYRYNRYKIQTCFSVTVGPTSMKVSLVAGN